MAGEGTSAHDSRRPRSLLHCLRLPIVAYGLQGAGILASDVARGLEERIAL